MSGEIPRCVVELSRSAYAGRRGTGSYPLAVAVDHHDHDKIVELIRVPSRFEADAMVAKLQAGGITASARHSDAGGWAPQFSMFGGHAVMVFDCDLDVANALIAEE
jgi:hypothetical protein